MNIEKLRTFLAAADLSSISKAAEKLHLSQPAASQQLSSLEKEIGFSLFSRTTHGIALTKEAEAVLPQMRRVVDDYDNLMDRIEETREHRSVFRIFYTGYMEQEMISHAVALMRTSNSWYISLHYCSYREALEALQAGKCDVAITLPYEFKDISFHQEQLKQVEMKVIAKKGTFSKDVIGISDLQKYRFLMLNQGNGQKVTDEVRNFAINELHYSPDQIIACDSIESQTLLISSGSGISMMPVTGAIASKFQTVRLRDKKYTENIVGVWKKDSEQVHRFLELCKMFHD